MKLWKWAAIALMLCGAALSSLFSRTMVPPEAQKQRPSWAFASPQSSSSMSSSSPSSLSSSSSSPSLLSSSSSSSSSLSSPNTKLLLPSSTSRISGRHRAARATDGFTSLLAQFNHMFQSFTEGELKQVIETLVDKKARRDKAKRTKRAKKGLRPCALRTLEVSVTELGLGYESDETVLFKYCSGKCAERRRNYDMTLEHMKTTGILKGKKDRTPHVPCCRPISYEKDLSFFANNDKFYTIHDVSAQECQCI